MFGKRKPSIPGTFLALIAAVALVVFPVPVAAEECVPGLAVYSPIPPYDFADCLEGGGSNCLRCRMIIIVR